MTPIKSLAAGALLTFAIAAPVMAQTYQSQCGWVGKSSRGTYVCHSKTETARAEVLTSCISRRGSGTECQSETFWKAPPSPPGPSLGDKLAVPKAVAGR